MKPALRTMIVAAIAVCIAVIAAASWHSVEEIHYLKTFYPDRFTVEQAFWASGVELIKVFLIALPLFLIILVGLLLIRSSRAKGKNGGPASPV